MVRCRTRRRAGGGARDGAAGQRFRFFFWRLTVSSRATFRAPAFCAPLPSSFFAAVVFKLFRFGWTLCVLLFFRQPSPTSIFWRDNSFLYGAAVGTIAATPSFSSGSHGYYLLSLACVRVTRHSSVLAVTCWWRRALRALLSCGMFLCRGAVNGMYGRDGGVCPLWRLASFMFSSLCFLFSSVPLSVWTICARATAFLFCRAVVLLYCLV